jgi:hypothetical protein
VAALAVLFSKFYQKSFSATLDIPSVKPAATIALPSSVSFALKVGLLAIF